MPRAEHVDDEQDDRDNERGRVPGGEPHDEQRHAQPGRDAEAVVSEETVHCRIAAQSRSSGAVAG